MAKEEFWLNVPQAIVLLATRNIELALGLKIPDPGVLVTAANQLVAEYTEVPLREGVAQEERAAALRRLRRTMPTPMAASRYLELQRRVHAKLAAGVMVKAARSPDGPLETIDPAEFSRLEPRGVGAADERTGATVLYDLRIHGWEFVASLAEAKIAGPAIAPDLTVSLEDGAPVFEKWHALGDPLPKLIDWARSRFGHNLGRLPGRQKLLEAHRAEFGHILGISEKTMRDVRRQLAPEAARKGGAPAHRR